MNSQEAKEILLLYRPSRSQEPEPEFAEALAFAQNDAELSRWFDEHCAVQQALRAKFQKIPVPEGLKEQILSERKAHTSLPLKRQLVMASILVVALLVLGVITIPNLRSREDKTFTNFRSRMVQTAARDYPKMDLETADLGQVTQYLKDHAAPADYNLPLALAKSPTTGCAILQWRGKTVSMVCFNSGRTPGSNDADLFLFVANRKDVPNAPKTSEPQFAESNSLATASWSMGEKAYVLAGVGDLEFLRKYF